MVMENILSDRQRYLKQNLDVTHARTLYHMIKAILDKENAGKNNVTI